MRVPKRVIRSNRNYLDSGFWPDAHPLAAVVGDFQDVHLFRDGNTLFNVAGQKRRALAGLEEQNDRIIVLIVPARNPIRRRMQNFKRADGLAGGYPANRNLLLLDVFDQFSIPWDHWITPQPKFA